MDFLPDLVQEWQDIPLYSTTYSPNGLPYTTVTQHYDANAAFQANMVASHQIQTLGNMMKNEREVKEQGYLKMNTIHPGECIVGYMNIKRKKEPS